MQGPARIFLAGLAALLPLVITLALAVWLVVTAERWLGGLLQLVLPRGYYLPGIGVLLALAITFAVGLLTRAVLIQRLFALGSALINRVPLLSTIYGAFRDLVHFITSDQSERFNRVVMVRPFPDQPIELIGFVTREDLSTLPAGIATSESEDEIAVYLPMSYQIGGYTLFVPRDRARLVDISMEDAMRVALTGGMSVTREESRELRVES